MAISSDLLKPEIVEMLWEIENIYISDGFYIDNLIYWPEPELELGEIPELAYPIGQDFQVGDPGEDFYAYSSGTYGVYERATTTSEMLFGEKHIGAEISIASENSFERFDALLFGESQGRVVVAVDPLDSNDFISSAKSVGLSINPLGKP